MFRVTPFTNIRQQQPTGAPKPGRSHNQNSDLINALRLVQSFVAAGAHSVDEDAVTPGLQDYRRLKQFLTRSHCPLTEVRPGPGDDDAWLHQQPADLENEGV